MNRQQSKEIALYSVQRQKRLEMIYQILDQLPEVELNLNEISQKLRSENALCIVTLRFLDVMWELQAAYSILVDGAIVSKRLQSTEAMRRHRNKVWKFILPEGIEALEVCLHRMDEKHRRIIEDGLLYA